MTATPTRWKKQLGTFLQQLRDKASKSAAEAAHLLRVAESTVSAYENGHVRPNWPAVQQLLQLYDATVGQRAEAETRWEEAGTKTKRVRMPADAPKDLRKLVRSELEAAAVRVLSPVAIPGLLQTEPYMRAINMAGHRFLDPSAMDEYVKARLNRQKRLAGPDSLRVHALIDEAAIRRVVGSRVIMRQQLGHLLEAGARPNVTIQVIPYEAGAYGPMAGLFMIVNYPDPKESPGVYVEYLGGGDWVDNGGDVQRITTTFDDASGFALTRSDSADLIRQQQRALESNDKEHDVAQE
ncbi:MAG: helix-turn-helix domain-containing protein [Candidatus Dormibacteraceae bacterium]